MSLITYNIYTNCTTIKISVTDEVCKNNKNIVKCKFVVFKIIYYSGLYFIIIRIRILETFVILLLL